MSAVWHGEALSRRKRLPAHDRFTGRQRRAQRQSPVALLAKIRSINAALGGATATATAPAAAPAA